MPAASLHVLDGGSLRLVLRLSSTPGTRVTIGRELECDIQLEEPKVSRRHCTIEADGTGTHVLGDLDTRNGTLLNGSPIVGLAPLKVGDTIGVGSVQLVYLGDDGQTTATGGSESPAQSEEAPASFEAFLESLRKEDVVVSLREGVVSITAPRSPSLFMVLIHLAAALKKHDREISWSPKDPSSLSAYEALAKMRMERWGLGKGRYGDALQDALELVPRHPDMALAKCRTTLEGLLLERFKTLIGAPKDPGLEALLESLRRKNHLPKKIDALCRVVQVLGNFGAHHVPDDELASHREAHLGLSALTLIIKWSLDEAAKRETTEWPPLAEDTEAAGGAPDSTK